MQRVHLKFGREQKEGGKPQGGTGLQELTRLCALLRVVTPSGVLLPVIQRCVHLDAREQWAGLETFH